MLRALDLAEAIEARDLTPRNLAQLTLEAITEREGDIHAFAHFEPNRFVLEAARHAGQGALFGLPVGVKDIIDTAAFPTEYGFAGFVGHRPMLDAAIVARLADCGGIVQGKTSTTPFAFLDPSFTRNPHDLACTPGGSSAGSAAGVAAGFFPLAIGTQTGGSTIRPASYCGVAAIKPSFRLLPLTGVKQTSWSLDTMGLFAARAADLAFFLEALCGRPMLDRLGAFDAPRIGVFRQAYAGAPDDEAEAALQRAIRSLESGGARLIDKPEIPAITRAAQEAFALIYDHEMAVCLRPDEQRFGATMPPALQALFARDRTRPIEAYDDARRLARAARLAAKELFEGVDAILTFSAGSAAPRDLSTTGDGGFNRMMTLIGAPAVNVPGLVNDQGLPIGVQIVAPFGKDAEALAIADFAERAIKRRA
jgi:Asp-tRNA(Asn)/Glu-tRNA(Gln) amidotransferase A subunit family amidase